MEKIYYRVALKDPYGHFIVKDTFHTIEYAKMLFDSLERGCRNDLACVECRLSLDLMEDGKFKEHIYKCAF